MFERIKRAFSKEVKAPPEPAAADSQAHPVSEWAASQGFGCSVDRTGRGISLDGRVSGKPWRLQLGTSSRSYIRGEEVRARAELGIPEDLAVLVINRPLKEALEKQAYGIYTDGLQTSANPHLSEEMRWLALYDEVGLEGLPREFRDRYSVLSDRRACAVEWIDQQLTRLMLDWPHPPPRADVPFIMLLLRGKAYLRMEYSPPQLTTLQHAALVFTSACESALGLAPLVDIRLDTHPGALPAG